MAKVFQDSFGRSIELTDNWYPVKNSWPYGIRSFTEFVDVVFAAHGGAYPDANIGFFLNKFVVFNYFLNVVRQSLGRIPTWHTMLDVGTGPGLLPRLVKAAGYADAVHGIDYQATREAEYPDELFIRFLSAIQAGIHSNSAEDKTQLRQALGKMRHSCAFEPPLVAHTFDTPAPLDGFESGDFLTHDYSPESFDLITAESCMEDFDMPRFFARVSELLQRGGIFYSNTAYFYHLFGSSMHLPSDAPWLHARLSYHDLMRYYAEHRPEIAEHARKAVYFPSTHMTVWDMIELGRSEGLAFRGFYRTSDSALSSKTMESQFMLADVEVGNYLYDTCLPEARFINPRVQMEDLLTKKVTLVFEKE